MAKRAVKTNAARVLERLGLPYRVREYEVGREHTSALDMARREGVDPATVFKTLVALGDRNGHCFAVVPANAELDLKALARASGDRRSSLVALAEIRALTGYVRGGVTALAPKRAFPVFLDETAATHGEIAVSAGVKGMQILLSPADYVRATKASLAALTAASTRG